MRVFNSASPFVQWEGKLRLRDVAFFSCGCGNVTARWASIASNFATDIPHLKPKSSRPITEWIRENRLDVKYPEFSLHQYGMVVAETANGIEAVNIMGGSTNGTIEKISDLIRRHNEYTSSH